MLAQPPRQLVSGAKHAHAESWQTVRLEQARLQPPQCVWLPFKSTQVPLQFVRPKAHAAPHCPFVHKPSLAQTVPQAPQFDGSLPRSAQVPLHSAKPAAAQVPGIWGTQRLSTQPYPAGHAGSPGLPQKYTVVREQLDESSTLPSSIKRSRVRDGMGGLAVYGQHEDSR